MLYGRDTCCVPLRVRALAEEVPELGNQQDTAAECREVAGGFEKSMRNIIIVTVTRYYYIDKIEQIWIGGACSKHGGIYTSIYIYI